MLRFLLVMAIFAVATYLVVRSIQRRGLIPERPARPQRPQRPRFVAPDDDEDFLRDLERKRRDPDDTEH